MISWNLAEFSDYISVAAAFEKTGRRLQTGQKFAVFDSGLVFLTVVVVGLFSMSTESGDLRQTRGENVSWLVHTAECQVARDSAARKWGFWWPQHTCNRGERLQCGHSCITVALTMQLHAASDCQFLLNVHAFIIWVSAEAYQQWVAIHCHGGWWFFRAQ